MSKKTVLLGASLNPERYAHRATLQLRLHGHEVVPIGPREGRIGDVEILTTPPAALDDVDTVTLYLGLDRQSAYYDYILSLHPKRLIFNPGTENPELDLKAKEAGIETVEGCTLVMLSIGNY
jgi:uncharacterized protein